MWGLIKHKGRHFIGTYSVNNTGMRLLTLADSRNKNKKIVFTSWQKAKQAGWVFISCEKKRRYKLEKQMGA